MKNKLEIIPVGNPEFPRLIIQDGEGQVFDGEKMAKDRKKAMMFAEGQAVAVVYNAIQEKIFEEFPLREFSVTMDVRVRSVEPFTKEDLEKYLAQVVSILLDHGKGSGLLEDSMVQLGVTWCEMQAKKSR